MEQEVLQIAQYVARFAVDQYFLLAFGQVVHHGAIRIQFSAMLVKVGDFQLGTGMHTTMVSFQLLQHQAQ